MDEPVLKFFEYDLDGSGTWMVDFGKQAKIQKSAGRILASTFVVSNKLVAVFSDVPTPCVVHASSSSNCSA
jgi:hypothetical protein